jgi:hypothetical protein
LPPNSATLDSVLAVNSLACRRGNRKSPAEKRFVNPDLSCKSLRHGDSVLHAERDRCLLA